MTRTARDRGSFASVGGFQGGITPRSGLILGDQVQPCRPSTLLLAALKTAYQRPDAATIRRVVMHQAELREVR